MADILHVIDIHAPVPDVFAQVATVDGIRRWWSASTDGGDAVGQSVTVCFGERWKVVMERTELVQNERVAYRITQHDSAEWPGTQIVFAVQPSDDWTILKLDHRGWAAATDFFRFCGVKWAVFLMSIKQATETGVGTPYPSDPKIGRTD